MLGDDVKVRVSTDPADQPVVKSSESYIWPICLPKDDSDVKFTEAPDPSIFGPDHPTDHPNQRKNTVNAMLAGWLDAPPISQAFSNLLGSSLTEADVLK